MGKYILKRMLQMIPVLLGVIVVVFTILYLTPGDAAQTMLGTGATEEELAAMRAKLGTDQSYIVQLGRYIKNLVLHGDFGTSWVTGRSVTTELLERFPVTMRLAALSIVIAVILGVLAGVISAVKQYSGFDNVAQVVGLIGVSIPSFWLALMLIIIFSVNLKWLPSSGLDSAKSYILPAVALGLASAAMIMRMTRSSMLDVVRQDYIRTARAKGQKEVVVIMKHALKNALIPIITVAGLQFGGLLGGSIAIESIFSIPGIGKFSVEAIKARNMPAVQGSVLLVAIAFSVINLVIDILYSFVDPRIRSQYQKRKGSKVARKGGEEHV